MLTQTHTAELEPSANVQVHGTECFASLQHSAQDLQCCCRPRPRVAERVLHSLWCYLCLLMCAGAQTTMPPGVLAAAIAVPVAGSLLLAAAGLLVWLHCRRRRHQPDPYKPHADGSSSSRMRAVLWSAAETGGSDALAVDQAKQVGWMLGLVQHG